MVHNAVDLRVMNSFGNRIAPVEWHASIGAKQILGQFQKTGAQECKDIHDGADQAIVQVKLSKRKKSTSEY
jgi:hypothetical protein